ncbi:MAG: SO_0444 family Cu/Zn efflux transporter [Candidatus Zixiibacteriota bacterium]
MLDIIQNIFLSIWSLLVNSAFLLLVGIFLAGILHIFVNEKNIKRFLKGRNNLIVLKASLLGVPLPLCSCSVLPIAYKLRQSGLNRGATTAFLISTPETGIDSISLTYTLTDPLMTVARPITAFITAVTAGLLVNSLPESEKAEIENSSVTLCNDGCNDSGEESRNNSKPFYQQTWSGLKFAFGVLLADLAPYLFFGFLLAGVVAMILGNDITAIPDYLKTGWGGYVGSLIIGLPLYICATSSTPLAAVLLGAGFSPGAILVFLLVGPATNLASLTVVSKILNKKAAIYYLAVIIVLSIFFGIVIDSLYDILEIKTIYNQLETDNSNNKIEIISAIILAASISYMTFIKTVKKIKYYFHI